jgi:two-component system nitrogen regulation response regulator GlnG
MAKLLVIDDEPSVLYALERSLSSELLEVVTAATAQEGLRQVRVAQPDVVVLDLRLPDMPGLEVHTQIRKLDPRLPVIVITAFATTETAIEAMRSGAFEYLVKPVDFRRLLEVVTNALEVSRLNRVPAVIEEAAESGAPISDRIIGSSAAMQRVYKAIGRVASQDTTVLILGDSGTGKELAARAIYHYSRRSQLPFLAINCAALPENLLESELFGHERGAFTGADRRRIGKFEQVDGGTIFLDEIGDMTPATQAKMLRLLQQQQFERLGGNEVIQTNVRVIAATNQNLSAMVESGRFRQDLFYRLNGFTIHLPPLREREGDLAILIDHFLQSFNRELNKNVRFLTPEAKSAMEVHEWPGNVRELESVIRFAMLHVVGDVLTLDCLPDTFHAPNDESPEPEPAEPIEPVRHGFVGVVRVLRRLLQEKHPHVYREICAAVDLVILEEVLNQVRGNQMQAAELLGISRTTLRSKLQALDVTFSKQVVVEPRRPNREP